jgi:hypothetical protein
VNDGGTDNNNGWTPEGRHGGQFAGWHSPQDEVEDLSLHHAAAFGDAENCRLLLEGKLPNGYADPMGMRDPDGRGPVSTMRLDLSGPLSR